MTPSAARSYGLLGRHLSHSWSALIHGKLGSAPYTLFEREPDQVEDFIRKGTWDGINVTIPYKADAARLADVRSPRVDQLGVANTLVRQADGQIFAENTDVLGFSAMLSSFCHDQLGMDPAQVFGDRPSLVLGTGGAAQAVRCALEEVAGTPVTLVSRTGPVNYDNLVEVCPEAALVVNATPVGMYPDCPASPLPEGTLVRLPQLKAVVDVIYNPRLTGLALQAQRLDIPCETGLAMLVWQALYASELFQGIDLDPAMVESILVDLHRMQGNIVLIGMPGAGKTSTGRILARLTGRPFVDLDDAFEVEVGCTAEAYIRSHGEQAFRAQETKVAASYGKGTGLVIACGGGIVTQARNYDLLHQNGTIAFIDRDVAQLKTTGRPLSQQKGIERLAQERMATYRAWADVTISCTGTAAGDAALLRKTLGI